MISSLISGVSPTKLNSSCSLCIDRLVLASATKSLVASWLCVLIKVMRKPLSEYYPSSKSGKYSQSSSITFTKFHMLLTESPYILGQQELKHYLASTPFLYEDLPWTYLLLFAEYLSKEVKWATLVTWKKIYYYVIIYVSLNYNRIKRL